MHLTDHYRALSSSFHVYGRKKSNLRICWGTRETVWLHFSDCITIFKESKELNISTLIAIPRDSNLSAAVHIVWSISNTASLRMYSIIFAFWLSVISYTRCDPKKKLEIKNLIEEFLWFTFYRSKHRRTLHWGHNVVIIKV